MHAYLTHHHPTPTAPPPCLARATASAATTTDAVSRSSSHDGWVIDEHGIPAWLREHLTISELLDIVLAEELVDHHVWFPPMIAIMAMRHGAHPLVGLVQPPLTRSFVDEWRQRHSTDVFMLALRLASSAQMW